MSDGVYMEEKPSMSHNAIFGELRSLLSRPHSPQQWRGVCGILEETQPKELQDPYIHYALSTIKRYKDEQRWVFEHFRDKLYSGTPQPLAPLFCSVYEHNTTKEGLDRIRNLWTNPDLAHFKIVSLSNYADPDILVEDILRTPYLTQLHHLSLGFASFSNEHIKRLCYASWFSNLRTIKFSYNAALTAAVLPTLFEQCSDQLERLELAYCDLGPSMSTTLAQTPQIYPNLHTLNLTSTHINDLVYAELVKSPLARSIRTLILEDNDMHVHGLRALLQGKDLENLEHLNIGDNFETIGGAMNVFEDSDVVRQLKSLHLHYSGLNNEDLAELVDCSSLHNLEELHLHGNNFSSAGIKYLAKSTNLSHLRVLNLGRMSIDSGGACALFASSNFPRLETLDLWEHHIMWRGMQALAKTNLGALKNLILWDCHITDEGLSTLAASPVLKQIEKLDLQENQYSHKGVKALVSSPYAQNLRELNVAQNKIGALGAQALIDTPHLHKLTYLNIRDTDIPPDMVEAIAQKYTKRFPLLQLVS